MFIKHDTEEYQIPITRDSYYHMKNDLIELFFLASGIVALSLIFKMVGLW